MAPDRAMAAIDQQALTYARRVKNGEINASAVESLLMQDACTFTDCYRDSCEVYVRGKAIYEAVRKVK